MPIRLVNILEEIEDMRKDYERKLEQYPESSSEYIHYKGLIEGLTIAWDIALNSQ